MASPSQVVEPVVYALMVGDRVGYVGRTGWNLQQRMYQHRYRASHGHKAPVYVWMREVGVDNIRGVVLVYGNSPTDEADAIKFYIDAGHPIVNVLGADGVPNSQPVKARENLSEKKRGKSTWIKGKKGREAGWTDDRRQQQSLNRRVDGPRRPDGSLYPHGSSNRYDSGCRCSRCVALHDRVTTARENRKARTHGTVSAYKHGGCRCSNCKSAYSEYQKRFNR